MPEVTPLAAGEPFRPGFRKVIAWSQIVGGAFMLVVPWITIIQGHALEAWGFLLHTAVGTGGVLGGVWLRRGDPRGWDLSRVLQGLQIIQLVMPTWAFGLSLGLNLFMVWKPSGFAVSAGVDSRLIMQTGAGMERQMAVNFFALLAFAALMRPLREEDDATPGDPRDPSPAEPAAEHR